MMKKVLIPAVAVMFLVSGCFLSPEPEAPPEEPVVPQEPEVVNEAPVAYIDAIDPLTITVGDEITMQGHGIDADGTIVAYRWRSDIDGPLGVNKNVSTTDLSEGEHIIYLKVQDNNGAWSPEVREDVLVNPGTPFEIVSFEADDEEIFIAEKPVTLSWEVTGADTVAIEPDIGEVAASGSIEVNPETSTDYVITATKDGQTRHSVMTITVLPNSYAETLVAVQMETNSIFDGSPPYVWFIPGLGISIGDTGDEFSIQGFASFDISDIPEDAVITAVDVDFSSFSTGGTPFADLGCIRVYPQNYGTLEVGDFFTGSPTGPILRYCSTAQIVPEESEDMRDALQQAVGNDRLQLRFQFNETESDGEGDQDYIHWDYDELILHIEYDSFE